MVQDQRASLQEQNLPLDLHLLPVLSLGSHRGWACPQHSVVVENWHLGSLGSNPSSAVYQLSNSGCAKSPL